MATDRVLDRRLAAMLGAHPELEPALGLHAQLIRAVLASPHPPQISPFPIPRDQIAVRLDAGVPLLHEQPASVDVHFAADLFSRLLRAVQDRDDPDLRPKVGGLVAVWTSHHLDPERLFAEALVQHQDHVADIAREAEVDSELLQALAGQAVAPVLRGYAAHLLPLIERRAGAYEESTAAWQRGYCPICGAWPVFAEPGADEGVHVLRCAACGSGWRANARSCPYCGNADPQQQATLEEPGQQSAHRPEQHLVQPAGQHPAELAVQQSAELAGQHSVQVSGQQSAELAGQHSAQVARQRPGLPQSDHRVTALLCADCRGYLKVVDSRDGPIPAALLGLEDLASMHLDLAAIERGYHRPRGSGFTIELAVPLDEWLEELA